MKSGSVLLKKSAEGAVPSSALNQNLTLGSQNGLPRLSTGLVRTHMASRSLAGNRVQIVRLSGIRHWQEARCENQALLAIPE